MTLLTVETLRKSLSSIGDDFYAHRPFTAQWRSHPKNLGGPKTLVGTKIFNFMRITLSRLEKRLSKHKVTICSKNLGRRMTLWLPLATPMLLCKRRYPTSFLSLSLYQQGVTMNEAVGNCTNFHITFEPSSDLMKPYTEYLT